MTKQNLNVSPHLLLFNNCSTSYAFYKHLEYRIVLSILDVILTNCFDLIWNVYSDLDQLYLNQFDDRQWDTDYYVIIDQYNYNSTMNS